MTEEEAKTKWCPFSRIHDATGTYNRSASGGTLMPTAAAAILCMGSACMAWRLEDQLWDFSHRNENGGPPKPDGEGWEPYPTGWRRLMPQGGYCGLAGRP